MVLKFDDALIPHNLEFVGYFTALSAGSVSTDSPGHVEVTDRGDMPPGRGTRSAARSHAINPVTSGGHPRDNGQRGGGRGRRRP
jgi:hypothetical protein